MSYNNLFSPKPGATPTPGQKKPVVQGNSVFPTPGLTPAQSGVKTLGPQMVPAPYSPVAGVNFSPAAPRNQSYTEAGSVQGAQTNTGGGLTSRVAAPSNVDTFLNQTNASLDAMKTNQQNVYNDRLSSEQSNVRRQYEPIFADLDKRLGIITQELSGLKDDSVYTPNERAVEDMYGTQLNTATQLRDMGVKGLNEQRTGALTQANASKANIRTQADAQASKLRSTTEQNKREIGDSSRNATTSFLRRLGAAGDGSAAMVGAAIIGKEGLKQKGVQLGIQTEKLNEIETAVGAGNASIDDWYREVDTQIKGKENQIGQIYTEQTGKLNAWKTGELNKLLNDTQTQLQQVESAKASATAEQIGYLNQVESTLKNNFYAELKNIDTQKFELETGIKKWAMERAESLEDYKAQLAASASYSTPKAPSYELNEVTIDPVTGETITVAFDPRTGAATTLDGVDLSAFMASRKRNQEPELTKVGLSNLVGSGALSL